jgi:hypothetical protein
MAHALRGAAQLPGKLGGALPARPGEQDLALSQSKGLRRAEPGVALLMFLGSQASNRHR